MGARWLGRLRLDMCVVALCLAASVVLAACSGDGSTSPAQLAVASDAALTTDALADDGDAGAAVAADIAGAVDASRPSDSGVIIDVWAADDGAQSPDSQALSDVGAPSRCTASAAQISCPYVSHTLATGFLGLANRQVHAQVPLGTPPKAGWPVAILFQGSFFSGQLSWQATPSAKIGLFHLVGTVKALLDAGYAVLTPEAHLNGATFWDTNIPPYNVLWQSSPDHAFMLALFKAIDAGIFGQLDGQRRHALGISSGGYMTSRMALSYPGQFRSLAIHSASWATCSGSMCLLPSVMPKAHPATLFLHGVADKVVPMSTMTPYRDALVAAGVATGLVTDPAVGHAWLPAGPAAVVSFFQQHP